MVFKIDFADLPSNTIMGQKAKNAGKKQSKTKPVDNAIDLKTLEELMGSCLSTTVRIPKQDHIIKELKKQKCDFIKNQVESYYNNISIPYFVLNFDDYDETYYEIEQYDDLNDKIQEIYDNPQDYTDYQNIYVEYVYNAGTSLIGYIKGEE